MNVRVLLALTFAAAVAVPLHAQFAITVQQNGNAASENNGGNITMNAPSASQSTTATVTVTYVGAGTATFPGNGELFGATNFTVAGGYTARDLAPFQSTTFTFTYAPTSTAVTTAEFVWPFGEIPPTTSTTTTTTTTTPQSATGAITFNLIGTAPNLVVSQVTSAGTFEPVANGGTFQFPGTTVNGTSSIAVAINNAGSGPGTVNSITATGAGYQVIGVPLLPLTLAAGAELNVTVQFQPTSTAATTGSLQIAFANGTFTAALGGTGVTSFLSYTVTQGGTTTPLSPGGTIDISDTLVGAKSSAVIGFQNTGATPFTLSTVVLSGAGFSLTDGPFLPITLQPGQSNSITVTFTATQPGPSIGRLLIGSDSFGLSAQTLGPTLTFAYQAGSGPSIPILVGGTVTFSPVVDGQTTSVQFTVTNTGTTAATLATIGVVDTSGVFTVSNLPALPVQLAPAASASFTLNYSPIGGGVSASTLVINNQGFGLTGFPTTAPALPSFTFTGASGTQQPFQQPAIGLSLASAYAYPLSGTLTITFATSSFGVDPAVQFSSGGRQVAFTIPAGGLKAVFPSGATQVQLQTGTVAGNILITPAFAVGTATGASVTPPNPLTLVLTVPPLAPTLLSAAVSAQSATSLSVVVTGFSDTRSLDHLTFQLTPASGFTLSGSSFPIDVSTEAIIFFESAASQNAGGEFTVTVPLAFSKSGGSSNANLTASISAISVSATNSTGTSNVLSVSIP